MRVHTVRTVIQSGLIALCCLTLPVGCGSVRVEVPDGYDVRLLEEEEPTSIRTQRRIWFWLWGGAAISDDTTKPEIVEHNLKEMRVDSTQTLIDTLLNVIGGFVSIVNRTVIIEGNPR